MPTKNAEGRIDRLMTAASDALVATRYGEAERLASEALRLAFAAGRYERMARILLPLQESRRQRVEAALDAGSVRSVDARIAATGLPADGCWIVQPPMVAADARRLRAEAIDNGRRVAVLAREPLTKDGSCPVVSIGPTIVRTRVVAPPQCSGDEAGAPPSTAWFAAAMEALGDEAIASVPLELAPVRRVTALLDRLESFPDHEKLHQALGDACRAAADAEPPRDSDRATSIDPEASTDEEALDEADEPIDQAGDET